MKTLKLASLLTLLLIVLSIVRCSDDPKPEAVTLATLSGTVNYPNTTGTLVAAPNAVVTLISAGGTLMTLTGVDGTYTFPNLAADTYDVSATFYDEPANARLDGLNFATAAGTLVEIGSADISQNLDLVSVGQSGTSIEALDVNYDWTGSAFANTGVWTLDAAHSPVQFEFPYRGNEADFIGGFSQINKFVVDFDPANLGTSTISVEVDMASVNTRTPGGRDNRTTVADNPSFSPTTLFTELGCIAGTFGITADNATPSEGTPQAITLDADRYAKFTSTSIEEYGDGYLAKGNLIFHGFTIPIELWFKVVPTWFDTSNSRFYSGFEGKFLMDAKNDFGITSSSINDAIIRIQVSIVVYKS